MTNEELIKALLCEKDCDDCAYHTDNAWSRCDEWGMRCDAADALEAANKQIDELEADKKTLINVVKDKSDFHATKDAMKIAELEAQLPKEGEWIIDGMNEYELSYGCIGYEPRYRCSKCGITTESYLRTERPIMPEDADFPNYCPNCGARMRGEHDEQIH